MNPEMYLKHLLEFRIKTLDLVGEGETLTEIDKRIQDMEQIMICRKSVSQGLNVSEEDLIWSNKSGNPETIYHDKEKGTVAYSKIGYWVVKGQ